MTGAIFQGGAKMGVFRIWDENYQTQGDFLLYLTNPCNFLVFSANFDGPRFGHFTGYSKIHNVNICVHPPHRNSPWVFKTNRKEAWVAVSTRKTGVFYQKRLGFDLFTVSKISRFSEK